LTCDDAAAAGLISPGSGARTNKYPAAGIEPRVSGPPNNAWKLIEVRGN